MLVTVDGYYDGSSIVLAEKMEMSVGQKVIVVLESEKQALDLGKYTMPTKRGKNVEEYMKEMRENDRY